MRLVKLMSWAACLCLGAGLAMAQQPIAIGPDNTAGYGPGMVKFFDWYTATATGGCVPGATGFCVGHTPQGDTYYWSAWMPNASGLPVTNGLPIVGTINDYNLGSFCNGNIGVMQLDAFNWAAPTASHMTKINCMTSYGTTGASRNEPAGWNGALTSGDGKTLGTWKSRTPFSKGGILYLPVERQYSPGDPSVHDATFIMSPDSGKHWCNPYTYANRAGGPGCDSSNWSADGDAPRCDAASNMVPCTNAAYLDSAHSSIMWKAMPFGTENWYWINYGYQDGAAPPTGINDGCDPATYACFMLLDGSVARVPNASIMDISAWRYYTCPAITQNYRCPGSNAANWTANFGSRTPVVYWSYYLGPFQSSFTIMSGLMYLKEFGSYLMVGQTWTTPRSVDFLWAPTLQGPWTRVFKSNAVPQSGDFLSPSPALGYTVLGTNPPHVQLTLNSNSYSGGEGAPHIAIWDLVLGRQSSGGEAFTSDNLYKYISGAGYQFSSGNIAGSFPRKGLVWSFDYLDAGVNSTLTNWPFFLERGNNSAVMVACDSDYAAPTICGTMNPGHGTSMNPYGIRTSRTGYGGHFRTYPWEGTDYSVPQNAPAAMRGNGSYSVVGVYRYEGVTPYSWLSGIWSTGVASGSDNTMIEFGQRDGKIQLDWNGTYQPHYQYLANFTFPNFTNWYFIAVTVQAQTSCGSNCVPAVKIWVGGASTPGVLADVNAGVAYTLASPTTPAAATKTPNVSAGPLIIGSNAHNDESTMSFATTMVYDRPLTQAEVQLMYASMKSKMKARGVTLQ